MNNNSIRAVRIVLIIITFVSFFLALKTHGAYMAILAGVSLLAKFIELVLWSCQESSKDKPTPINMQQNICNSKSKDNG